MKTNLNVDTQELRERILDLAMRGKLVKQEAGDEPASVLLEKIKAKKAELVKEGKIKKSKKLPEITDDEKPFDIPDSWKWVRLGDVSSNIHYGFTASAQETGNAKLLRITDIQDGKVDWSKVPFCNISKEKENGLLLKPNDVLIARTGGTVGKSFVIQNVPEKTVFASYLIRIQTIDTDIVTFLEYFLRSPLYWKSIESKKSGTGQPNVNATKLSEIVFPFPPLAEQKRIADKVSDLFKQVDVIEKNVAEYQDLEQAMRSKLLDLAMRGKLVEQDQTDEPASELLKQIQAEKAELVKEGKIKKSKKLPEITNDEKPFEIPDSWEWVRLGDVGDWGAGATPLKSNHEYYEHGTIPWILTGDLNDGHISSANQFITEKALNETSVKIKPTGSVLIAMYGATIGKLGILDIEATTNQACCACVTFSGVSNMYLFDYLMFMKPKFIESGVGGAQPNISRTKIVATPIPLPPLAEQKRIADKLTRLFEDLDTIKQNLATVS